MYNYQEDIKKSLGEISEKLNVEPKNRPAAYNIHEEIANTLHDISEKVSEGGAGGGPGYEVVPTTETVLFDGEIQAVNIHEIDPESENDFYILPLYTDVDDFPDNWPRGTIFVDITYNGVSQGNIEMHYSENNMGYFTEYAAVGISYDPMSRTVFLWTSSSPAEGDVATLHVVGVTERHVVASDDFKEAVGYKITDPRTFASGSTNEITENGMCVLSEDILYPIDEWPEKLLLLGTIEYFVYNEDISHVENFNIPFVRMNTDGSTYATYAPEETQEAPIVQAVIATTEEIQLEQVAPKGFSVLPRQDENFRLVSISAQIAEEDQTVEVSDDFKKAVKAAGTGAPPVRYVKTMVPHPFASAFFDLDVPFGDDSLALSYNDIWGENPYVQLVVFDSGSGSVIVQRSGEDDIPIKVSLYSIVSNSTTDYKPALQLLREYTANSKDDPIMWQS